MSYPVLACYRGFDSAAAVQLGAVLAGTLGEPLVLTSCYTDAEADGRGRREPASAGGRQGALRRARGFAGHSTEARRRADADEAAVHRARVHTSDEIEQRELNVAPRALADALVGIACEVDACLIALGRDMSARATRALVASAPCPIAIAPLTLALSRIAAPQRIGVSYDGSLNARWTLIAAAHLARSSGAVLELLAAASTSHSAAGWLRGAQRVLAAVDAAGDGDLATLDVESRALVGDPAATLTDASTQLDLVVCGAPGQHPTTANAVTQLVEQARCPVVVVPHGVWRSATAPLGITSATQLG